MTESSSKNTPPGSVDPPARIAILGAGPIGIEAALYARYLGYDVVVFERHGVAANLQRWGHVQLLSVFAENSSSLGLAAIAAQDPDFSFPAADSSITGAEWANRYVIPLSETDLLADHIRTEKAAVQVRKQASTAENDPQSPDEVRSQFQVLVRDRDGHESTEDADIVIDATGVFGNADGCGPGGQPADGETPLKNLIEYGLPNILGSERSKYASKRTLVVGDTIWSTINLIGLSHLIEESPATRVTWNTENSRETSSGPSTGNRPSTANRQDESTTERRRLPHTANRLVCDATPNMRYLPETTIESLEYDESAKQFRVIFSDDADPERFDRVVVNTGYHRDTTLFGNLWPDLRLSLDSIKGTLEELDAFWDTPQAPATVEPNFYVLGAKSFGRDSRFLFPQGLLQIQRLFAIIGGRDDLDLYATTKVDPQ